MGAADRIAEVILRQGEIAGRGAQNNGAIWGGALQNLGQQITALPTYVQNQRMREQETAMRDQEMQMRGMALQQQQRGVADQQSLDDAMRAGVVQDANGNYVADRQKVSSYLMQRAPHLLPTIQKHWADADETDIKRREAQGKLNDAEVEDVARLASTGLTGLEHGLSAEDSAALILPDINAHGANGIIDPESHKRLVAQLDAAKSDPQAMKTLLEGWRNKSKAQSEAYSARALAEKREQPAAPKSDLFTNETELRQDAATLGTTAESPTAWRSRETLDEMEKAKTPAAEPTVTIRTTDKNGHPIERVMTRSQALAEGSFPSQTRAAAAGGAPGTPQLTQDAIEDTATRYRILGTGAIPTRIEGPERVRVMNEAAKQQRALGQSAAQGIQKMAANKADAASLTKMQSMADAASASEAKALAQADLVGQLSSKVNRSQSPLWNDWLLSGKKKVLGDQDTTLLFNALDTFTSEYAKIINGSTGSVAGASDSATKKAEGLISAALNKGTLQATVDQMKWEMGQTIKGYGATIEHINDRLQTGAGGAPAAPAAAPAPGGLQILSITPKK